MIKIDSLRISVTDRCNFRCLYCMPLYGVNFTNKDELLTYEEILYIVKIIKDYGINKFRITGGEPLIRKDLYKLIKSISDLGVDDLSLTTNGYLLGKDDNLAKLLKSSGLRRINISLDTVDPKKFYEIVRPIFSKNFNNNNTFEIEFFENYLNIVKKGIENTLRAGFSNIKINAVLLKFFSIKDIVDLIDFCISRGLVLRFIEFMDTTPVFNPDLYISYQDIINKLKKELNIEVFRDKAKLGEGPAKYYKVNYKGKDGLLGFIYNSLDNCSKCGRIRLSSDGFLRICIYQNSGFNLKEIIRSKDTDLEKERRIRNLLEYAFSLKSSGEINYTIWEKQKNYMFKIGG